MKKLAYFVYEEIKNSPYFQNLTDKIARDYSSHLIDNIANLSLTEKEKKDLFRFIDLLSSSDIQEARMKSYHIISLLEVFLANDESFNIYSAAVYSKLGLYALGFESSNLSFSRRIEFASKKIKQSVDKDFILTDVQYEIYYRMINSPHFSFSGPTSLGKSFIIRRYIKKIIEESVSNIVVLVPSKALINQYMSDIKLELSDIITLRKYSVLTHSNVGEVVKKDSYIFILTPERLLSLYGRNAGIKIDFLFVDEAHKLSNSSNTDERSLTLYCAIDKTLKNNENTKLIFASPNIANPEIFLELFNKEKVNSIRVNEAPVSQNLYLVDFKYNSIKYIANDKFLELDTNILGTVRTTNQFIYRVGKNNASNMIYCSSKAKAIDCAYHFYESVEERDIFVSDGLKEAISKISSYIHEDYYLVKFLEKGIAYHHGQLPQIIRNIIEKLFREGEINFIFCTPTLVEGVNMPTKNIFINCDHKIRLGGDKMEYSNKTIAFWNLAGRAGRYRKELSGNIFCIQHDDSFRWDNLSIFEKSHSNLLTSIDKKIHDKKSVDKLKSTLEVDGPSAANRDKVEVFLSKLISLDSLQYKSDPSKSFILNRLVNHNRHDVIDLGVKNSNKVSEIPMDVLESMRTLDFDIHLRVYNRLQLKPIAYKLPKIEYENIKEVLERFYEFYSWDQYEKDIKSIEQLRYYSAIMTKWVSGVSLNLIIEEELRRTRKIKLSQNEPLEDFDRKNLLHVNHIIDGLIYTIEKVITFTFEKYFNHYHKVLITFLGEDKAGHNWATYLEYGSQNPIEIGLQNLGLSRHTSHSIANSSMLLKCVDIDEVSGEIKGVDKKSLLKNIDMNSLEYDEITSIL